MTQVAPTILALLGLNPYNLQAVLIEHARVLPGVSDSSCSCQSGGDMGLPPTAVTGSTIAKLKDTCGNLIQISQLERY